MSSVFTLTVSGCWDWPGAQTTIFFAEQARAFSVRRIVTPDGSRPDGLSRAVEVLAGSEGLAEVASLPDADIIVVASSGHTAFEPVLAAINARKTIAIANKESIVCAGELFLPLARQTGARFHPIDSEHSAIWQSLGDSGSALSRLILTASGGPFRYRTPDSLAAVTVEEALNHPNWDMGGKITIDSATMMNKGLEIIEAHWLFGLPYEQIDVLIHPESIIHSIIEFEDKSQIAQLSLPDMRLPIQYALTYPDHLPGLSTPLDLATIGSLTFARPNEALFPALRLARDVGRTGGTLPTVMSAADDLAVDAFLNQRIGFADIVRIVEQVVSEHSPTPITSLEDVIAADADARERTELISQI